MHRNNDSGIIRSRDNNTVRFARALHDKKARRSQGAALLEGIRLIEDAILSGAKFRSVLYESSFAQRAGSSDVLEQLVRDSVPVLQVSASVFGTLSDTSTSQGIVAVVDVNWSTLGALLSHPSGLLLALDGVQDPGNVGTIIRSAAAAGAAGVIIGEGTADPWSPKCVRASMGGIFRTSLVEVEDWCDALSQARKSVQLLLAEADEQAPKPWELDLVKPTCLILANEGSGPSASSRDKADARVMIPMPGGTESLNVASAAAILLYEATRQRARMPV